MTYSEFIDNILNTRGRFACGDEYHERHHILPKCMNGTNDEENLIDLFAKEHFIAHQLLAKENPNNKKLIYAWWNMAHCGGREYQKRYECSPAEYEEARIRHSQMMSKAISGKNNPMYGKYGELNPMFDVHRYGEDNPFYGRHHTEETKIKISEAKRGKPQSIESNKKRSESERGAKNPRARKVIRLIDLKIYDCLDYAAEDNSMHRDTIWKRCKKHNGFMYYDEYLTQQNDLENNIC